MKIMEKESIASMHMTANVRREIAIMKALTHDNIVRLRQVLASPQRLYLVMDFVQGGELFTKIHRDGALTENEGRHYFRQLVAGVAYCHSRGVVHRDLKPENLLLDSRTSQLKIADFGLSGLSQMAAGIEGEQLLHTQCGSPNYCAPEILEPSSSRSGYNGALVDTWSVGVILYVLLAGRLPFYDPDPRRLYEAIATSVVQFPANFPEGAADIVRHYTSPDGPTLSVVDDVELDREENDLRNHGNARPVRAASGGSVTDGAPGRFVAAHSTDFDGEVSMFSDALASSVISGPSSRPTPSTRGALPVASIASTQFGNKFASGDAVPRDSAVTSNEPSSRGGEWRDSSRSGSGEVYRPGPRSLHPASPGMAKRAEGRVVPAPPSLGAGGLGSTSSGRTTPPSLAELSHQGRLSVGGTGQSVAWAQDDGRRGRAGVRSLLGLTSCSEPPSFSTSLPARECLRTIGTILSDMHLTVFLKKNQNKMKCQVGLLRGLPMWASICYVESGGSELNSVVFKRAREDHSRFDHMYLERLCNSVHIQYRHAVEMSTVRAAEAARDQA
ncbi:hypothetical protein MMPV_003862 [Pyropia vietnamensis]